MNLRSENEVLRKDNMKKSWMAVAFFCIVICLILGLVFTIVVFVLQPKGRTTCASFGSYNDALRAYSAGATWLDHDGDGIPCEALYARDNPGQHGE